MTSFTSPSTVEPEFIATDPAPSEDEEDGHHQRRRKDVPSSHRPRAPPPPGAELFTDVEALRVRLSSSTSEREGHSHDQGRSDGEEEGEGDHGTSGGTEVTPGRVVGGDHHDDGGVAAHDVVLDGRITPQPQRRLTVLDCTPRNVLNFAQGEWDMVMRDLLLSGIDVEAVDALESDGRGPCGTVVSAFRLRRELVHYKKVCLHLFQEGRGDVERRLRRVAAFHHVADPRDDGSVAAGMLAHFEALMMNDEEDGVEKKIADISEEAEEGCDRCRLRSAPRSPCALLERKRLLVASSRALSRHRGAIRAVHDARDVVKAICMTPRHPDDDALRPEKLRSLPRSMYVHQACETAEAALSAGCLRRRSSLRGHVRGSKEERNLSAREKGSDPDESDFTSTSNVDEEGHHPRHPPPGLTALDLTVRRSRDELSWPEGAASFLRTSLVARGGYKALAMAEELALYETHLCDLVVRCESLLRRFRDAHESCVAAVVARGGLVGSDDLSAAVRRDMHVQILTGALGICRENSRWISAINDIMRRSVEVSFARDRREHPRRQSPSSRLFVTRDDVPSNRACSFVPRDFAMGSFLARSRHVLEHTLEPAMREAVAREGWPPGEWTGRTRVRTVSAASSSSSLSSTTTNSLGTSPSTTGANVDSTQGGRRGADGGGKKKKEEEEKKKSRRYHPCRSCGCNFLDGVWVRLGLCAVCEDNHRRSAESSGDGGVGRGCIFDCGLPPGSYCPHSGRCFSCDAPHSCEVGCRMSRGNGEVAAALVETMRPRLLLIDFDRTLSSTKSGASPLPTGRRVERRAKGCDGDGGAGERGSRGHEHTVDDELKAAVLAQRDFGVAHVITRNSHRREIERFLSMNGMADLARNVHIVPKKKSKGAFIRERFYPCESCDGSPDEESTGSAEKLVCSSMMISANLLRIRG